MQGGEEKQRILATIGPRDPSFLVTKEDHAVGPGILAACQQRVAFLQSPVFGTANIDEIGEVDEAHLPGHGVDPCLPLAVKDVVIGDGRETMGIVEPVARETLEAIEEEALWRRPLGAVAGLAFEDRQAGPQVEPPALRLGLLHHEGLEGAEIVVQPCHRRREGADELELSHQVVDRHRQLRGCQHLLSDRHERLLGGDTSGNSLRQRPEQVGLFDVFLAVEHGSPFPAVPDNVGRDRDGRLG